METVPRKDSRMISGVSAVMAVTLRSPLCETISTGLGLLNFPPPILVSINQRMIHNFNERGKTKCLSYKNNVSYSYKVSVSSL